MNRIQKLNRKIISSAFYISVKIIKLVYDMKKFKAKKIQYLKYPNDTIGNKVSRCLVSNKLDLIPVFENHDLKHIILDYDMTPVDEIKLQAFMFGNGNHSLPCITILLFGMLLLPDEWSNLYCEFQKGKNSIPISHWKLDELAKENFITIKSQIKKH